jgi:hypothetical protein
MSCTVCQAQLPPAPRAPTLWHAGKLQQVGSQKRGLPMDSAIISLLGAFLLSIIGLFVFIWSLRKGLLVENPQAASVIFAQGEIGRVDDPALANNAQNSMPRSLKIGLLLTAPRLCRYSCLSLLPACGW